MLMDDAEGSIEVWQEGVKIIDEKGKTLPTFNSIQTNLEVGITATSQNSVIYADNISLRVVKK